MRAIFFWSTLALLTIPQAADASHCTPESGPFLSTLEQGPGCSTSPIAMCTHGQLHGALEARYEFTFQTLTPDPYEPTRSNYTGVSVIAFTDGRAQMFSQDAGFFLIRPDGEAIFETTVHFTGGTADYLHASGQLVASGLLDFATGSGDGSYIGSICRPSLAVGCEVR